MYACSPHDSLVPSEVRGQKRASDPLKWELWVVVSCHVGSANGTQVLCKSSERF